MAAISQFATGFRLFTGEALNAIVNVVNNITGNGTPQAITGTTGVFSSTVTAAGIINTGGSSGTLVVVAAAGATQGTATAIAATAAIVNVTATTSSEGVQLPTAATGKQITLLAPTTKGVKVYGKAAGQLINANTTATTAYALTTAQAASFVAVSATLWRVLPNTSIPINATTITGSGQATLSGGLTVSGAQKETITVVAAAGATAGTATQIAAGAVLVNVTVTASTEGVRLPTASTGRVITLVTPTTKGYKVYGGAAGQLINAGTTNTTAFAMSTNKPATFFGVDGTHWRASKSA